MLGRRLWFALLASLLLHAGLLAFASRPQSGRAAVSVAPPAERDALQVAFVPSPLARPEPAPTPPMLEARPAATPAAPPAPADALPGWDAYLPGSRLDERPKVIADIPIDPPELRQHPEGGIIVATLWIGIDGQVDAVTVEAATLPAVFIDSALRGFRLARFRPGMKDGQPVKSKLRIELDYRPLPAAGAKTPAAIEPR